LGTWVPSKFSREITTIDGGTGALDSPNNPDEIYVRSRVSYTTLAGTKTIEVAENLTKWVN
jgi:hypothetical protein